MQLARRGRPSGLKTTLQSHPTPPPGGCAVPVGADTAEHRAGHCRAEDLLQGRLGAAGTTSPTLQFPSILGSSRQEAASLPRLSSQTAGARGYRVKASTGGLQQTRLHPFHLPAADMQEWQDQDAWCPGTLASVSAAVHWENALT